MKKTIFALVAMVMMTMSANAQSENNSKPMTFGRLSSFLELRVNQVEPVKTAMAQFEQSMGAFYQAQNASKGGETWEKILAGHKKAMKKVLSKKQYEKYVNALELTVKNTAESMMHDATASK